MVQGSWKMADDQVQTQSAKLGADYWLTLSRSDEPDEWTVRLLGPSPTVCTISAETEEEARTLAAEAAVQYFRENSIDAEVPEVLRWTAATRLTFRVRN